MPITLYELGDGLGGSFVYEGRIRAEDEHAGQSLLESEPRFRKWKFLLVDASAVESVDYTREEIAAIALRSQRLALLTPTGYVMAIVAPSNHVFGQGRMWQTYSDPFPRETRLFRSRDEADSWIREKVKRSFGTELDRPIQNLPASKLAVTPTL